MTRTARKASYRPEYYSFSKIIEYLNCKQKYKYLYVDGGEQISNEAMEFGKKIHTTCEKLMFATDPLETAAIMKGYAAKDQERALAVSEFFINKEFKLSEFRFELHLARGINVEFHMDTIYFDDMGLCHITDFKTSPIPIKREEIEEDLQLAIYAWAWIKYLRDNVETWKADLTLAENDKDEAAAKKAKAFLHTAETGDVVIGIWLWRYHYIVEALKNFEDMTDPLISLITSMKAEKAFTRTANRFCPGCPFFRTCFPEPIKKTYYELKQLENYYAALVEAKRSEIINSITQLDLDMIEESDANIMLNQTRKRQYSLDDLKAACFQAAKNVMDFMKQDTTKINDAIKKGDLDLKPFATNVELKLSVKQKLPKVEAKIEAKQEDEANG